MMIYMVYTEKKFEELVELLDTINNDNNINNVKNIIIDFITNQELKNKVINNEFITIDEIKEDIISNIKIDSNDYSVEEFIKFANLIGKKQDGSYYKFDIYKFNLINKIKNMSFQEQEIYAADIVTSLKSQLPFNIIKLWPVFCEKAQRKSINQLISKEINPSTFFNIWYSTKEKIKEEYPLNDFLNIIKDLIPKCKDDYDLENVYNVLNYISLSTYEDNYETIIKFIRENNLDICNILSRDNPKETEFLGRLFKKNIEMIVDYYIDNMKSIENLIGIFNTPLNFIEALKNLYKTESEKIGKKIYDKIKNEDSVVKFLIDNNYNNISILLWKNNEEFKNNISKKDVLSLIENNIISIYDVNEENKELLEESINEICSLYINQNKNIKLLEELQDLPKEILEKIDPNHYYNILNEDIITHTDLYLKYYNILPNELKQSISQKVLNKIINEKIKNYMHYSSDRIEDMLKDYFKSSSKDAILTIDEASWDKIFTMEDCSIEKEFLFKYAPDNIRNKYINSYLDDASSQYQKLTDLQHLSYKFSNLPKEIIDNNKKFFIENNNKIIRNAYLNAIDCEDISDELLNKIINDPNRVKNYKELLKYNENINKSIIIDTLDDKIVNFLGMNVMTRITAYPEIQLNLLKFKDDEFILNLVKNICDNYENWVELLDYGLNKERSNLTPAILLLKRVTNGDYSKVNGDVIKNCYRISNDKVNYFRIGFYEQIVDYNNILFDCCMKILNGTKPDIEVPFKTNYREYDDMDRLEQLKLAISEIEFGMDYDSVLNLTKKYSASIEDIDTSNLNSEEMKAVNILKKMKSICNIDDLDNEVETIKNNKDFYFNKLNSCLSSFEIEKICINMYNKLYQERLFTPKEKITELAPNELGEYNFNMLVRCEGAFDPNWEEPENFKDSINRPRIEYRGNCKSYIGNNLLALARSRGPIYGYSKANISFQAPWDIFSNGNNQQFSLSNIKWNYGMGVEFLTPSRMIDRTRHSHNEFVSDRLIYNKDTGSYEKDYPDYVIWIKTNSNETEEDRKKDDLWRITQKAANDLEVPIVIIDKEKILESEQNKIYKNIEKLKKADENTDVKSLLKSIVVEYQNNMISVKYDEQLGKKYFTEEKRENMFNQIESIIEEKKNINPIIYNKYLNILLQLIIEEMSKTKTNKGKKTANVDYYLKNKLILYKNKLEEINKERNINKLFDSNKEEIITTNQTVFNKL